MKHNNLQTDELRAFVAVAEKGSFRAAADALFISAPALSRRIERLETALGNRLLERTTRRVALTDLGRQFLDHATTVIDNLDAAFQQMTHRSAVRKGSVTIATVPSAAQQILPAALLAFSTQHPEVRVKVIDEGAQEGLAQVIDGTADFGLNFIGAQEPGIDFQALHRETYLLAVPAQHRLAQRSHVSWKELEQEKMIAVSRTSGNRLLLDNALARLKHRPVAFHEVSHVSTLLHLVRAGVGIGAVPSLSLQGVAAQGVVGITLTQPTIRRTLGLITRRDHPLSTTAAALYAILRKQASHDLNRRPA